MVMTMLFANTMLIQVQHSTAAVICMLPYELYIIHASNWTNIREAALSR